MERFPHPSPLIEILRADILACSISPQPFFKFYFEIALKLCKSYCLHRNGKNVVVKSRKRVT